MSKKIKQKQRGREETTRFHPSLTLEQAKKLLGVDRFPGNDREVEEFLLFTERLLERNGETWVCENKGNILAGWKYYLMS